MKVGLDATPLLGNRTGIGHYTSHLLDELAVDASLELAAVPFSLRRAGRPGDLPTNVRWKYRPIPARAIQMCWRKANFPPVEMLVGGLDVFHATNFVLPPLRRAAGVMTVHDLSFVRYPDLVDKGSLALRELVPHGLRTAKAVLTPTAAVAQELLATYRLDDDLVTVSPLGVDPQWASSPPFSTAELALRGLPSTYIMAVGTLEPRKGLDILIEAYRQLNSDGVDIPPLVLVGPTGWGRVIAETDLPPGRLFLPGYLHADELRRVVAGASIFVFPSRYEGFGLPPLEALAAGVPVVASDIATSVEVLGSHAMLPEVGSVDALAEALIAQIMAPEDQQKRERAREYALSWTWKRCAAQTKLAYLRALS